METSFHLVYSLHAVLTCSSTALRRRVGHRPHPITCQKPSVLHGRLMGGHLARCWMPIDSVHPLATGDCSLTKTMDLCWIVLSREDNSRWPVSFPLCFPQFYSISPPSPLLSFSLSLKKFCASFWTFSISNS